MLEHSFPVVYCIHDDHWRLASSIRTFASAGPVTVFASTTPWFGEPGNWKETARTAAAEGAEVIVGDWPNESTHRKHALAVMRGRGTRLMFIPDGDELISVCLLHKVMALADADAASGIAVSMATYWRTPEYVIQPPEKLTPSIMIDAQVVEHVHTREYRGPTGTTLGRDRGYSADAKVLSTQN